MAFSAVTERGSIAERSADNSIAVSPSANLVVGRWVVVYGVADNTTTTSGDSTDLSLADTDGHTWTKLFERTRTSGSAADGVTHAAWLTQVANEISTSDVITMTLGTTRNSKVLEVFEFQASGTVTKSSGGEGFHEGTGTAPSAAIASLASLARLWIGFLGVEEEFTTWTEDADYTNVFSVEGVTSGPSGVATTNVAAFIGTRIATLTGDTFAPTVASADFAAALIALEEGAATQTLDGALFTVTPSFPTGTVTPGTVTLSGSLFTVAVTFPTGVVQAEGGPQTLTGTLATFSPTFPTGVLDYPWPLTGALFSNPPTFFTGSLQYYTNLLIVELDDEGDPGVDTDHVIRGEVRATAGTGWVRFRLFQSATLIASYEFQPTGSFVVYEYELLEAEAANITDYTDLQFHVDVKAVTHPFTVEVDWVELLRPPPVAGDQNLTGTLFTKGVTFPTGVLSSQSDLVGILFTNTPTFPTGAVSSTYALTGTLFVNAPTFPTGTVSSQSDLVGVLFTVNPTFPTGVISSGATTLTGVVFSNPPQFFVGTVGVDGSLTGVLFVNPPQFFVGMMGQTGGSFWRHNPAAYTLNPAAYTLNPAAYVPVGPDDVPPWPIELEGVLFHKEPSFFVGAVS